jgi:hypothetical protein
MAKRKNKKRKNDPLKEYPSHFVRAEIIYKNENDLLGTIKFIDEELSDDERLENFLNESSKKEFPLDIYLSLIEKFKNAKDKNKLRFDDFEIRVLEKALNNCCSYLAEMPNFNHLRMHLAWANTVFKDTPGRTDVKLRTAGRTLGFTNRGRTPLPLPPFSVPPPAVGKQPTYEPEIIIPRYKELIESGIDKIEAVKQCAEEFSFASPTACGSYLREHGLRDIPDIKQSLHVIFSPPPSKSR